MKNLVTVFVLLLVNQIAICQDVKFGKVSKEELLEKEYPNDRSANAAILYRNQNTYIMGTNGMYELITEVHERIKIYNQEGFDYATERIHLFKSRNEKERVRKIKAYTFNLDNGDIKEDQLEKSQIFENEVSYHYDEVSFTLPNVKEGSVLEFSYTISSPFIFNIDEFRFQYEIPVKKLVAELRTPKGFEFRQTQKGYLNVRPVQEIKTDHRLGMEVDINTFHMNNVPGLENESHVDNIENYRSGVMFELVSINYNNNYKSFATSWQDVAQSIGNSEDYKNQLDKTRSFDDDLDQILSGSSDPMDKMKTLFKYVKENIVWNGIDGKYFYNGLRKTLKEKKGNAADINLLLVAMLRYVGLNANPVVISTKDNSIPLFPTLDRLNYVLAYVVLDDNEYFLDATDEFSDVNMLPIKDYNWNGILIDNNNMVWKMIDLKQPNKANFLYSVNAKLEPSGSLNGEIKARFTEHGAYMVRQDFKHKDLNLHISSIESRLNNIEIEQYKLDNADTYEGYVNESFAFTQSNASTVVADQILIEPMALFKIKSNPFQRETREFPIDFGFPFKKSYNIQVEFPEGYKVESAPESIAMNLPNELGSFKYLIEVNDSGFQIAVTYEINKPMISPQHYDLIKQYYNQIIMKEAEQIVLKKI